MTTIMSMSLDEETHATLDQLQKELGFNGRSETIRAGIRALTQESKMHAKLTGNHDATLTIVHAQHDQLTKLLHRYQRIIKTHLHNHLHTGKCLDIFVLSGNGVAIKELTDALRRSKHVDQVSLTVC